MKKNHLQIGKKKKISLKKKKKKKDLSILEKKKKFKKRKFIKILKVQNQVLYQILINIQ